MNILRLDRFFQLESAETDSIEAIKLKYSEILNSFDFGTRLEPNGIYFKRKLSSKNGSRNIVEPWKVFQEGDVSIFVKDNKLNINWSVKLDILYFPAGLLGLASGCMVRFNFGFSLFISIISGLFIVIILSVIGAISIMIRIDEINDAYQDWRLTIHHPSF